MRPTVEEQLRGVARILREVVAPAVDGDYPSDMVRDAAATLDLVAKGWSDVPAYLAWDAARSAELLRAAGIDAPRPPDDPYDIAALAAHHEAVRALLADHIDELPQSATVAHFRERAARYPIKA